jgi:hypothetical protein
MEKDQPDGKTRMAKGFFQQRLSAGRGILKNPMRSEFRQLLNLFAKFLKLN